jgi:hypothetical protein
MFISELKGEVADAEMLAYMDVRSLEWIAYWVLSLFHRAHTHTHMHTHKKKPLPSLSHSISAVREPQDLL